MMAGRFFSPRLTAEGDMQHKFASAIWGAVFYLCVGGATDALGQADDLNACQDQGNPDNAIQGCGRIIDSKYANNALRYGALVNRCLAYMNEGRDADAVRDCTAAIKLNPGGGEAFFNRGLTYTKMRDIDRALPDFDMTITLMPEFSQGYFNRGVAD